MNHNFHWSNCINTEGNARNKSKNNNLKKIKKSSSILLDIIYNHNAICSMIIKFALNKNYLKFLIVKYLSIIATKSQIIIINNNSSWKRISMKFLNFTVLQISPTVFMINIKQKRKVIVVYIQVRYSQTNQDDT